MPRCKGSQIASHDDLTLFFVNNYTLGSNYGYIHYISSAQDQAEEVSRLSGEDEFSGRT